MLHYAGIGSRETPANKLAEIKQLAHDLAKLNYILNTGNADGADYAFMCGAYAAGGTADLYNPWKSYNIENSKMHYLGTVYDCPTREAIEMAAKYHPAWDRCSQGAQKLHGRNMHIILGYDLKSPVKFVVCWHNGSGGTMQGVRCAIDHKIPVYNLKDMTKEQVLERIL